MDAVAAHYGTRWQMGVMEEANGMAAAGRTSMQAGTRWQRAVAWIELLALQTAQEEQCYPGLRALLYRYRSPLFFQRFSAA